MKPCSLPIYSPFCTEVEAWIGSTGGHVAALTGREKKEEVLWMRQCIFVVLSCFRRCLSEETKKDRPQPTPDLSSCSSFDAKWQSSQNAAHYHRQKTMDEGGQPVPARSTLLSTYWRDPEWLAYFPLNANTVVDYFSRSTFFDLESTNEVLRMQNIANPNGHLPGMGKTAKQQQDELTRFTGIEFVLVLQKEATGVAGGQAGPSTTAAGGQEESLFIIQKRRRFSPVQTQVLDTYYVLNGNVHMAPDLETVLANRLVRIRMQRHDDNDVGLLIPLRNIATDDCIAFPSSRPFTGQRS